MAEVLLAPQPGREVQRFLGFRAGLDVISKQAGGGRQRGMRERVSRRGVHRVPQQLARAERVERSQALEPFRIVPGGLGALRHGTAHGSGIGVSHGTRIQLAPQECAGIRDQIHQLQHRARVGSGGHEFAISGVLQAQIEPYLLAGPFADREVSAGYNVVRAQVIAQTAKRRLRQCLRIGQGHLELHARDQFAGHRAQPAARGQLGG